ncbi:MAG TPA: DUF1552 domain-containing protein [Vicinamibacterales bacterium]|nr:DUF1552 domain-containing protein [Vicinamibacterales bacterium]
MSSFITKQHLSRRTVLHGLGVTLALPVLESMLPAATAFAETVAAKNRTRFGAIYFPHGVIQEKWIPASEGTGYAITPILEPIKPFVDRITVVSNLKHAQAYGSGATANHNRAASAFLSGAYAKTGAQPHLGVTVDQVIAKQRGQDTPMPSLELAIEGPSVNCGDGLSCSYRDTISWQSDTSPLPMQNNPQVVFERLFGDGNDADQRKARRQQSLSLLDSVLGEASSLQQKLPAGDRARLDQYLTDVREIERRIQKAGERVSDDLHLPPQPTGVPSDVEEHIKLMYDLQVLAWQTEITRVSTFQVAHELSNSVYPKSTIRDAFHILSHHSNIQENKDRFTVLNRYHVGLFTYFLDKLQKTPDGDGTLLDHSLVLYGSGLGDGNQHDHADLPVLVAGGASGQHTGGRHIRTPKDTPMSNLLVALLDKMDLNENHFGDSSGVIAL